MNRSNFQKRFKIPFKKEEYTIRPSYRARSGIGLQDTIKPKEKFNEGFKKGANDRCVSVSPERKDFGQIAATTSAPLMPTPQVIIVRRHTKYKKQPPLMRAKRTVQHLMEKMNEQVRKVKYAGMMRNCSEKSNGIERGTPETETVSCVPGGHCDVSGQTVGGNSQRIDSACSSQSKADDCRWYNVDNIQEAEQFIENEKKKWSELGQNTKDIEEPSNISIAKTPRVKVIVEKFTKCKSGCVELRKLDEKVVCIEYDVFDKSKGRESPVQCLRAFFSLKPSSDINIETFPLTESMTTKFAIDKEDLKRLDLKEVEIIDGAIDLNKSYLEDLSKILKRRDHITAMKQLSSLNIDYIYEKAKKERLLVDYADVLLSKSELDDVKGLILDKCPSSIHGFDRTLVQADDVPAGKVTAISKSILNELTRQLNQH